MDFLTALPFAHNVGPYVDVVDLFRLRSTSQGMRYAYYNDIGRRLEAGEDLFTYAIDQDNPIILLDVSAVMEQLDMKVPIPSNYYVGRNSTTYIQLLNRMFNLNKPRIIALLASNMPARGVIISHQDTNSQGRKLAYYANRIPAVFSSIVVDNIQSLLRGVKNASDLKIMPDLESHQLQTRLRNLGLNYIPRLYGDQRPSREQLLGILREYAISEYDKTSIPIK